MPSEETLREYEFRINKVINYISQNLGNHLNLDELADVALFSKFHFHRIFSAMVGETINDFIRRLRLEKAATMLIFNPRTSLTDIALDCGFSSSANFTKAYKQYFNVPPSFVRNNYNYKDFESLREILERNDGNPGKLFSNIGKEESNSGKDLSEVISDNIGMKLMGARKVQIQT